MKWTRRILAGAAAAACIAVIAVVVLWVRGHFVGDSWGYEFRVNGNVRSLEAHSFRGRLIFALFTLGTTESVDEPYHDTVNPEYLAYFWNGSDRGFVHARWGGKVTFLSLPSWLPAGALGLGAVVLLVKRKGKKLGKGAFPVAGLNSPESSNQG